MKYLKKSPKQPSTDDVKTREIVQKLLNELEKTGPAILAKNTDEFIKGLEAIPGKKRLSGQRLMKGVSVGYDVVMSVPTGGSIPRLRTKTTPAKGGKAQKAQKFISSAQLSALTQKRMGQIMPKGPKKGPKRTKKGLKNKIYEYYNGEISL